MYRFIMRLFKQVLDTGEHILFTVDDWLRYRKGDSTPSLVLRTVLGVIWFPISYLSRFFILVLIEPGFNPAKAPQSRSLQQNWFTRIALTFKMAGMAGRPRGNCGFGGYAGTNRPYPPRCAGGVGRHLPALTGFRLGDGGDLAFAPDIFGFLFWETKENWSMYRANLHAAGPAPPCPIGPHGETVQALAAAGLPFRRRSPHLLAWLQSGTTRNLDAQLGQRPRLPRRTRRDQPQACEAARFAGIAGDPRERSPDDGEGSTHQRREG